MQQWFPLTLGDAYDMVGSVRWQCATGIQLAGRAFVARRKLRFEKSIRVLQRAWRGRRARMEYRALRVKKMSMWTKKKNTVGHDEAGTECCGNKKKTYARDLMCMNVDRMEYTHAGASSNHGRSSSRQQKGRTDGKVYCNMYAFCIRGDTACLLKLLFGDVVLQSEILCLNQRKRVRG